MLNEALIQIGLVPHFMTESVAFLLYFIRICCRFESIRLTGFVQTMESPGIKMLRFPGLESPGKRHRSWKTLEKSWNSKVVVLEILISGTSIAN